MLYAVNRQLSKFVDIGSAVFIGIMTTLVLFQIVNRLFFQLPLPWTEEFCRYSFVWTSMFASAKAVRDHLHIAVDLLPGLFPDKSFVKLFQFIVHILCLIFFAVLIWQGAMWCGKCINNWCLTLHIKIVYIYSIIPVGFLFMLLFELENLIVDTKKWLRGGAVA